MSSSLRFGYSKAWEGEGAFLVLAAQQERRKFYVVLDANQKTRGVKLETEKRDGLKPSGAMIALVRKHQPSGFFAGVWKDEKTGDLWLPVTTQGVIAHFFQIAATSPPELRFVTLDGTALVRKSSQGTFTKRRTLEGGVPLAASGTIVDVTAEVFAALDGAAPEAKAPAPEGGAVQLPEFQREARDRLARKLKTLKKYVDKTQKSGEALHKVAGAEAEARLLQENAHRVREGMHELVLEDGTVIPLDPDVSPGTNVDRAFVTVKKLKRAALVSGQEAKKVGAEFDELTRELARVRAAPLPQTEVERILSRFKLAALKRETTAKGALAPLASDWREFVYTTPRGDRVPILVGKGAAGNDVLTKQARGDDWWFHAIGLTGSHVIVSARSLKAGVLPPDVMRAACILALHHSRARESLRGEVYVTRKRHLRKTRGLAVGLWLVDKAETSFVAYGADEANKILGGDS